MSCKTIFNVAARAAITVGASLAVTLSPVHVPTGAVASPVVLSVAKSYQTPDTTGCKTPGADSTHWYVMAYQCGTDYTGISATLTIPKPPPKIDTAGGAMQSNGQITLEEDTGRKGACGDNLQNAIEVSWVVSAPRSLGPPLYNTFTPNDGKPFLQVGRWVNGVPDYTKDWHPYPSPATLNYPQPMNIQKDYVASITGGIVEASLSDLSETASGTVDFQIQHKDGQWQVIVDGREIGYYPDSTWGSKGFQPNRAAWWGEVGSQRSSNGNGSGICGTATTKVDNASCTSMGDGALGGGTASFTNMAVYGGKGKTANQIYVTDPKLYGSDQYSGAPNESQPLAGDSFKYGGPGQCDHSTVAPPVASPPQNSDPPNVIVPPKNLGPVVIPPPVIIPQTGTGFTPPNNDSKQKRCGGDQCYDKEKYCLHGHGTHGECNGIPEKVQKGSGSNDSCPNGMIRISPETDTNSGCVLASGKQEHPKKQGHDNPQKEGHKDGHRQDYPQRQGHQQKDNRPGAS